MAVLHRGLLAKEVKTINKPFVLAEVAAAVRDAIDNPSRKYPVPVALMSQPPSIS
jgi:hypothetical protein